MASCSRGDVCSSCTGPMLCQSSSSVFSTSDSELLSLSLNTALSSTGCSEGDNGGLDVGSRELIILSRCENVKLRCCVRGMLWAAWSPWSPWSPWAATCTKDPSDLSDPCDPRGVTGGGVGPVELGCGESDSVFVLNSLSSISPILRTAQRPQPTFTNSDFGDSRTPIISRRCFDKLNSPKPGIVDARCAVMCRIGRGPCWISSLLILSAVTAAAAATATGECVFNGFGASPFALN